MAGIDDARVESGRRLRLACIVGTRPEAIKLAPVVLEARRAVRGCDVTVITTGQHRELCDEALADFSLAPDIRLDVMRPSQRPMDVLGRISLSLPSALDDCRPDVLLVQGDTTSALAGALAAHHARVPVGHVEAGLRTADRYTPFPEEMNRRLVSTLATWHFAPTHAARERLRMEGIADDAVLLTGNTVVDAVDILRRRALAPTWAERIQGRLILLTCHRRENHGARLRDICAAVSDLASMRPDVSIVVPVHPNPDVERRVRGDLGSIPRVLLVEPLPYREMLWLLERSTVVLTDSGGLQEEAPAFGVPVLVLREVTERPEGVAAGVARLVGTSRSAIVSETVRLLDDERGRLAMIGSANPYGDGRASARILDFLLARLARGAAPQTVSAS